MNEPATTKLDELAFVIVTMLEQHYPGHASALESSLFDVDDLAVELSQILLARIEKWSFARETGAVTLAQCVLLMLPHLHPVLCTARRKSDHCAADVNFCASMLVVLASWQLGTPFLAAPAPLVGEALSSPDSDVRCDRLEVAFRPVLAPRSVPRQLPSIVNGQ